MKSIYIPLPPIHEQHQIARWLDWKTSLIDRMIGVRRRELEGLEELRKAAITREVMRGDWERVRLKRVARINPPCDSHGLKSEDEVTFAPMECIRTDRRIPKDASLSLCNSSYTVFNNGDIALAKVTPCFENGNVCVMENLTNGYAFGSSELFNVRPFNVDTRFLLYYFMSHDFKSGGVASMTGAVGLKRVSPKYLRNALLPLPPAHEQHQIADRLDKVCSHIDSLTANYTRQIELLRELKASLITEAVIGRIDLRNITIPSQEDKS
ncbi:MAG: restriction endonuclease subunit S [Synergistaceae bacterium]|nr:restriction endonuclease subunit S [Synergistaceae bacterium]